MQVDPLNQTIHQDDLVVVRRNLALTKKEWLALKILAAKRRGKMSEVVSQLLSADSQFSTVMSSLEAL